MNEIQKIDEIMNDLITVTAGSVTLNHAAELLEFASNEATLLDSLVVTVDTKKEVTESKNKIGKMITFIENLRKEVKKQINEPYAKFESEIKPIVNVLQEAKNITNHKLNEIDDLERAEKELAIKELWELRISKYEFKDLIKFSHFLRPSHLNKTYSINKVEQEIVDLFEMVKIDIENINRLDNNVEILNEYLNRNLDFSEALMLFNQRQEALKEIKAKQEVKQVEEWITIKVKEKQFVLVKNLLEDNGLDYKL